MWPQGDIVVRGYEVLESEGNCIFLYKKKWLKVSCESGAVRSLGGFRGLEGTQERPCRVVAARGVFDKRHD